MGLALTPTLTLAMGPKPQLNPNLNPIQVWQLPEASYAPQLKHLKAVVVPDALLCGVGFAGGAARDHVVSSAYDVDVLHSFELQ